MLFNSSNFLIFLSIVLFVFHFSSDRKKRFILLVASYVFYSFWNWKFSFLLLLSTVVDYWCGHRIQSSHGRTRNKFLLVSLFVNLGILAFFKYCNFFIGSFADFVGLFGLQPNTSTLQILLPIGISFYTFQTLSYTIDIWRKKIEPVHDFWQFALYVSFFPQLVAGPIERARTLLPQLKVFKKVDGSAVWKGTLKSGLNF